MSDEQGFAEVERVKIAEPILLELDRRWSKPVELMVTGRDADGDLELTFRLWETSPANPESEAAPDE